MKGKAKAHDVCIIFAEAQGRGILWEILKGHLKKIDVEFAVEVMELIVALAVWGVRIHLCKVVLVVGTVFVDALPDHKELSAFHRNQGVPAERASEFKRFVEAVILRREERAANLAQQLAF